MSFMPMQSMGDGLSSRVGLTLTRRLNGAVTTALNDLSRRLGRFGVKVGYQHVLLGDLAFDLITYFEGAEESFGGEYAEHGLIGGKPRLQNVGDKLDELKWSIVLHAGYCDPEAEVLKLRRACAAHQAMPLVYANGNYRGHFIPVEGSVTTRQTMRDGTLIWVEANLTLREFAAPPDLMSQTARRPARAAVSKLGKKPASSGTHSVKPRGATQSSTRSAGKRK